MAKRDDPVRAVRLAVHENQLIEQAIAESGMIASEWMRLVLLAACGAPEALEISNTIKRAHRAGGSK